MLYQFQDEIDDELDDWSLDDDDEGDWVDVVDAVDMFDIEYDH